MPNKTLPSGEVVAPEVTNALNSKEGNALSIDSIAAATTSAAVTPTTNNNNKDLIDLDDDRPVLATSSSTAESSFYPESSSATTIAGAFGGSSSSKKVNSSADGNHLDRESSIKQNQSNYAEEAPSRPTITTNTLSTPSTIAVTSPTSPRTTAARRSMFLQQAPVSVPLPAQQTFPGDEPVLSPTSASATSTIQSQTVLLEDDHHKSTSIDTRVINNSLGPSHLEGTRPDPSTRSQSHTSGSSLPFSLPRLPGLSSSTKRSNGKSLLGLGSSNNTNSNSNRHISGTAGEHESLLSGQPPQHDYNSSSTSINNYNNRSASGGLSLIKRKYRQNRPKSQQSSSFFLSRDSPKQQQSSQYQIPPRRHPHTTASGPRGIDTVKKNKVLSEIRPDLTNLPEELLREQAKSNQADLDHDGTTPGGSSLSGGASGSYSNSLLSPSRTDGLLGSTASMTNDFERLFGRRRNNNDFLSPNRRDRRSYMDGRRSFRAASTDALLPPGVHRRRVQSTGAWDDQRLITQSVFTPVLTSVDGGQPIIPPPPLTADHTEPMTSQRFVAIVDSVKEAIHNGLQPLRISQGSSGSYFCRNADGKVVGVFKPKNEEPYGHLNPKWAKWVHRNLFPCCFGRSCLIPNLGYISEAATSLVDRRLKLNIVPTTEVVWLSSPAFHYDYLDKRAARNPKNPKPLPDKVGSFQLFLNGFKDANIFLRDHPFPEDVDESSARSSRYYGTWRRRNTMTESVHSKDTADTASLAGSVGAASSLNGSGLFTSYTMPPAGHHHHHQAALGNKFHWTPALQQQFKEQFEKMVILDYLIRNTDRGLDNWMIRYCEKEGISIVAGPPGASSMSSKKGQQQQQQHQRASYSDRGSIWTMNSSLGIPTVVATNTGGSSGSALRSTTTTTASEVTSAGESGSTRPSSAALVTPPGTPPGIEVLQDQSGNSSSSRHSHSASVPSLASLSETDQSQGGKNAAAHLSQSGSDSANPPKQQQQQQQQQPVTVESHYGANHLHVAAIDNGLAFPFKHPDSWRSYPYGWLFMDDLANHPFSKATRDHFLPLLSSPQWWRETIADLRRLFSIDSDFDQGMFDKQIAVMKGQGWNIVETLKNLNQGPKDMCRRVAVVVWDEERLLGAQSSAPGGPILSGNTEADRRAKSGTRATVTNTRPLPTIVQPNSGSSSGGNGKSKATNGEYVAIDMVEEESELSDSDDDDDDDDDEDEAGYDSYHEGDHENDADDDDDANTIRPVGTSNGRRQPQGSSSSKMKTHRRRHTEQTGSFKATTSHHLSNQASQKETHIQIAITDESDDDDEDMPPEMTLSCPSLPVREESTNLDQILNNVGATRVNTSGTGGGGGLSDGGGAIGSLSSRRQQAAAAVVSSGGVTGGISFGEGVLLNDESRNRVQGSTSTTTEAQENENENNNNHSAFQEAKKKWAERIRRGLSFDGTNFFSLPNQESRRQKKLRRQRQKEQKERELLERRVILVERLETVTTNKPYFEWW